MDYLYKCSATNYVNDTFNTHDRRVCLDWTLYAANVFEFNLKSYNLGVRLLDNYAIENIINDDNAILSYCVCQYLADKIIGFGDQSAEKWVTLGNSFFTLKEFTQQQVKIFAYLEGNIIIPTSALYIDDLELQRSLSLICNFSSDLIKYKPTLIADLIRFVTTGKLKCHVECEIVQPYINLIDTIILLKNNDNFIEISHHADPIIIDELFVPKNSGVQTINMLKPLDKLQTIIVTDKPQYLSEGSYGKVSKVQTNTSAMYAAKTSALDRNGDIPLDIINEVSILSLLRDNNKIISLKGFNIMNGNCTIYMCLGDKTLLNSIITDSISNKLKYLIEITKAVIVCHKHDIVHCDIKPNNIIIVDDVPLLIDFGTSEVFFSHKKYHDMHIQTVQYRSPEVLLGDRQYTNKVDVWSLGCIMYEIITGKKLFALNEVSNDHETDLMVHMIAILGKPTDCYLTTLPNKYLIKYATKIKTDITVDLKEKLGFYYDVVMSALIYNPQERASASGLLIELNKL